MSAERTKIFGMNLGIDPKLIVLALVLVAGALYYFTSGSESSPGSGSSQPAANITRPAAAPAIIGRPTPDRRQTAPTADRATLKLVPVNGTRGDVDPTLRLSLLDRVKNIPPAAGLRNLFEAGGAVAVSTTMPPVPPHPTITPKLPPAFPQVVNNTPPPPPPFTIPLKYFGFVKPVGRAVDGNRGFFMDGDSILIGAEGDVLEKRFLIVALTPSSARLEDTQVKQGQDLQVIPEAAPSQ